jgi:hypothetical protein
MLVTRVTFFDCVDPEPFNAVFRGQRPDLPPESRISKCELLRCGYFRRGEWDRLVLEPLDFEDCGSAQIDEPAHTVVALINVDENQRGSDWRRLAPRFDPNIHGVRLEREEVSSADDGLSLPYHFADPRIRSRESLGYLHFALGQRVQR